MRVRSLLVAAVLVACIAGCERAHPPREALDECRTLLQRGRGLLDPEHLPRERREFLRTIETLDGCSLGAQAEERAALAATLAADLAAALFKRSRLQADFEAASRRYGALAGRWPGRPEAVRARLALADLLLEAGSTSEARALYAALAKDEREMAKEARRQAERSLRILAGVDADPRGPASVPAAGGTTQTGGALLGVAAASAPSDTAGGGSGEEWSAPATFTAPSAHKAPAGPAEAVRVLGITVMRVGPAARVVVATDKPPRYSYGEIPAQEGKPARVFIDIPGGTLQPGVTRSRAFPQSKLLGALRAAHNKIGQARVVLELREDTVARAHATERPPAVVMEVRARKDATDPPELRTPKGLTLSEVAAMPIRRVVVDPGHGGGERGAVGQGGLEEKEVTLDVARRLVPMLQRQGLEVLLTRESDRTVPLEERTRRANELRADLFISIHANASTDRSRDGVEVYYLDMTDDAYARRLAQRENQGSGISMADLQLLTADLMTRAHTEDSARLAAFVERGLERALKKRPSGRTGVRKALFHVLLGAKMPAILCEISYVSNPKAEQEMREPSFRERAARGIAEGVAAYLAGRRGRIDGGGRGGGDVRGEEGVRGEARGGARLKTAGGAAAPRPRKNGRRLEPGDVAAAERRRAAVRAEDRP